MSVELGQKEDDLGNMHNDFVQTMSSACAVRDSKKVVRKDDKGYEAKQLVKCE